MTTSFRTLQDLTTGYSIFEKDQVLTETQLNSITNYLNDQNRLASIYLVGVGVISGLRVSLSNLEAIAATKVTVTKGIGITTDGDLLYYSNDVVCDRYIEYDKSYPKYAPFYLRSEGGEEEMISVYELIPEGVTDSRSTTSLSEFSSQTSKDLNNMVAVLLMESYVNDPDLCTGTDCDNLGQDCVNTPRLLLVEKDAINLLLKPAIATPDQAFRNLKEVVSERPLIGSSISSVNALVNVYQNVCSNIYNNLVDELSKIYPNCAFFLTDVFSANPSERWVEQLKKVLNDFTTNNLGFQYYYDFLKDVVETYNQFRDLLFGDNTWCCPDINWFPKHLLLGNLVLDPAFNLDENRTAFYPSPAIAQTTESLNHAKFLIRKLDTLIETFQVPAISAATDSIRITPSLFEDQPLEERAIPYYYQVNREQANPIHKRWNYQLSQRRMDNRNYSYNAPSYGAQGAALNPLAAQIGKFSFFRIEGHLGQNVENVLAKIESEIQSKNLPFTVRAILLGKSPKQLIKPDIRYSDLHRIHYLLRQDAHHQLEEVSQFSRAFKKIVDDNVIGESNAQSFKELSAQSNQTVTGNAEAVGKKLNLSYRDYKSDQSWKPNFLATITAASEFKLNVSPVLKTEFTTPFDSLISNTRFLWLDWLDEIIKKKDETEDEKLLFANFASQNSSIEHFAGVSRGGTFVLIYDDNNTVVADFMLPYYHEDKVEEAPIEKALTKPEIRPDTIINQGIRVLPSLDRRLFDFRGVLEPELIKKFDLQQKYFDVYKGFIDTSTGIYTAIGNIKPHKFTDPILDVQVREAGIEQEKVGLLKQRATQQPSDKVAGARAIQSEIELAQSLVAITDYIATSNINVAAGSEGSNAMQVVSEISVTITQGNALETLRGGLNAVANNNQNNATLVQIIKSILSPRR
ncbi:hypothetical protein APA_1352 [Pseudanabaena sp. lw0831]|uniref:hypothetical protein n=1 Tax=Pseudanabaena sp. lw0831 TaxID=1357935 RepID=UPI001915BFDD|nr:hypothetical protein [Pseudanabaena sp. lw0831]GBO53445.1 hypothetical protein APA_1352 [Pseudanabaena sp. lw0831]